MKKRARICQLLGLSLCTGLITAGCGCSGESRPAPPNILLITLDTTRADHLGFYGHSPSVSPNLDELARASVVYDRAYSSSSWTMPSHASLFTGLLPSEHGAGSPNPAASDDPQRRYIPLAEEYDTLAELLSRAGYRTSAIVGGPAMSADFGFGQGFDAYDDHFGELGRWHGKRAEYVTDRAIDYVDERSADEPWFLFLNYFDPHTPYEPPGDSGTDLPPPMLSLRKVIQERFGEPPIAVSEYESDVRAGIEALQARYRAEIRYMDEHLGRLFRHLEGLPPSQRPLVAITSDHGESFGEHYYFSHGLHVYEEVVRVPLLVRDLRVDGVGRRITAPVGNTMLFALLTSAAGIAQPPAAMRMSGSDEPIVTECPPITSSVGLDDPSFRSIMVPPYKLIVRPDGRYELYQLERDPEELVDLVAAEPDRAQRMSAQLESMLGNVAPHTVDTPSRVSESTARALEALGYLDRTESTPEPDGG